MVEYSKKIRVILPLLYTYDFGAPVWRLRPDATAQRLALEIRDGDLLLADFYTLELTKHELAKLPLPAAKNWWLGLEDAHEGVLFIHGYGDRQIGLHKGILAYNAETGTLQWEQPELAFYGVTSAGILALDLSTQTLTTLQTQTGTILTENLTLEAGAKAVANYNVARNQLCTYPMLYLPNEVYFTEVADFLEQILGVKPIGGIEYAETEQNFVISYYTEAGNGKTYNLLAVFTLKGDLLLNEPIATGLSGIGSDTFIIFNLKLYFIRQRTTLVVYSLT
ncbi:DUF4905 domain-containing protein [Pontibacter sp. H259]|uniref:DUF4905 domain-containing protein n=1 Tax=Pontibacter sp. H259 TaxID=3133421 RepID=UPI0030C07223